MDKVKVLFLLKRRPDFNVEIHNKLGLSTGLYNSAKFMNDMLVDSGIESNLEVCIDNNEIDKYVAKYRPTHVIVEALWVVPTKFDVLCRLHPTVKWIVRLHSEMPFIACEGIAMDWIAEYCNYQNISVAINSPRILNDIQFYIQIKNKWSEEQTDQKIFYLPNYYPQDYIQKEYTVNEKDVIDICCFGAIRPLKNQLLQAFAALQFAHFLGKKLRFHINSGRLEMKGEPVYNNLKALFTHLSEQGHELIIHEWTPREEFIELCSQMDIALQVSFSETFNIVGADLISQGIPLVGSDEIPWATKEYCAEAQSTNSIFNTLILCHNLVEHNIYSNQRLLTEYTNESKNIWLNYFK